MDRFVRVPSGAARSRSDSIRYAGVATVLVLGAACTPIPTTTTTIATTTTTTTRAKVACTANSTPAANDYAAYVETPTGQDEIVTFEANSPALVAAQVAQLEISGDVIAVGPDQPVRALIINPNDNTLYPKQWGDINPTPMGYGSVKTQFTSAWATADGTGVKVAVIDTGVQANHPDLVGQVITGRDFIADPDIAGGTTDPHGHGTHVAGIIAAADNAIGVVGGSPLATILPVRVLDSCGSGSTSDVAAGVLWAKNNGAKVINMSLGSTGNDPVLQAAVDAAVKDGVTVVAAAGNSASLSPLYPGAYDSAIGVGAIDGTGRIASYSNRGVTIDIAAPGSTILSTLRNLDYGAMSGTSMASPVVAASVALLLQKCPLLTPASVLARLRSTMSADVTGFTTLGGVGVVQPGNLIAGTCV